MFVFAHKKEPKYENRKSTLNQKKRVEVTSSVLKGRYTYGKNSMVCYFI